MKMFIVWRRVYEGKSCYSKGEAVHVYLVVICGARFIGDDERVVVCGKVGKRRSGRYMTFELSLDFGRAEEGIGNQPTTLREFLNYQMSAPLVRDVSSI